jgi:hypothetical protein
MFRSNDRHQGAHCLYFAKVIIIKLISQNTINLIIITLENYKQ